MPVILDEAGAAHWMNGREPDPLALKRLLVSASDNLLVVQNDGPELLEDLTSKRSEVLV
jgi:hypothetical protein